MDQAKFIHDYIKKNRPKFNRDLFVRKDEDIINALRYVIYSIERDASFVIKVLNFEVITDYDDVNHILWEYEDSIINKGKKPSENSKKSYGKKNKVNQYEFINLNDSALNIIKVDYFIQITEKKNGLVSDTITVYIAVPKIIDNFYFRLNGNTYSAIYQIVDASTYNNSASKNSKKQSITLKTLFTPIRVYRYAVDIKDFEGTPVQCNYFVINVFRKSVLLMKYIIAKFGYYQSMRFLNIQDVNIVYDISRINKEENYIFPVREYFIVVPKMLYDNNQIVQSFVYTVHSIVTYIKDASFGDIFTRKIYLKALGSDFTTKKIDTIEAKGESLLESLEFNYDLYTRQDLKLSEVDKHDIYCVLRWMMYEFNALRQKDNLDISTKKVRYASYISSLYGTRLASGLYRVTDEGDGAGLNTIKKAIQIPPMYLINAIIKCELVNYKNSVNDLDSILALKYTFKGVAGIGEKSNAISDAYRSIHPSHLGRVDIDSSSNSDPGVSGTICPYAKLYDGHFDEYKEPSTWETNVSSLLDTYNKSNSKVDMCRLINDNNLSRHEVNATSYVDTAIAAKKMMPIIGDAAYNEYINGYDIFGDGRMFYTNS